VLQRLLAGRPRPGPGTVLAAGRVAHCALRRRIPQLDAQPGGHGERDLAGRDVLCRNGPSQPCPRYGADHQLHLHAQPQSVFITSKRVWMRMLASLDRTLLTSTVESCAHLPAVGANPGSELLSSGVGAEVG